mmetsp:Transcript_84635/g.240064  ORF Transcript_84635/g.240064 Transcript_84635/m.240064 type:complete len:236 (-) Transcript_84635:1-708(-)
MAPDSACTAIWLPMSSEAARMTSPTSGVLAKVFPKHVCPRLSAKPCASQGPSLSWARAYIFWRGPPCSRESMASMSSLGPWWHTKPSVGTMDTSAAASAAAPWAAHAAAPSRLCTVDCWSCACAWSAPPGDHASCTWGWAAPPPSAIRVCIGLRSSMGAWACSASMATPPQVSMAAASMGVSADATCMGTCWIAPVPAAQRPATASAFSIMPGGWPSAVDVFSRSAAISWKASEC